jgi:signal peptidase I
MTENNKTNTTEENAGAEPETAAGAEPETAAGAEPETAAGAEPEAAGTKAPGAPDAAPSESTQGSGSETPEVGPRTARRRRKRAVLDFVRDMAVAFLIAIVVVQFFRPTVVRQSSMLPNFEDGDYLIVSRQAYKLFGGDPDRGDVIVFDSHRKSEDGSEKYLIKRVIGLPGETITITGGTVYINGEALDQSYTMDGTTSGEIIDYVIPEDTYFCCGDNRLNSLDSRSEEIGVVSRDSIFGKVVFRLYPFSKFGTIMDPYED